MTVSVSIEAPDRLVVRASGVLMRAEVDEAKHKVFAHMMENGKAHVLIMIEPGFSNLQAFASWDDITIDKYIQQHIIRMAIVGDLRWRDSALLFFLNSVVPFQMEYFKGDQEEFAKAWLLL